jgi:hypothetical protein
LIVVRAICARDAAIPTCVGQRARNVAIVADDELTLPLDDRQVRRDVHVAGGDGEHGESPEPEPSPSSSATADPRGSNCRA